MEVLSEDAHQPVGKGLLLQYSSINTGEKVLHSNTIIVACTVIIRLMMQIYRLQFGAGASVLGVGGTSQASRWHPTRRRYPPLSTVPTSDHFGIAPIWNEKRNRPRFVLSYYLWVNGIRSIFCFFDRHPGLNILLKHIDRSNCRIINTRLDYMFRAIILASGLKLQTKERMPFMLYGMSCRGLPWLTLGKDREQTTPSS